MILFEKKAFGTNYLFFTTLVGSSFPKAFIPAVLSVIIYFIFIHFIPGDYIVNHPYTYGIAASAIGFLVVFRLNQAHIRLSEAASDIYTLESKILSSVMQINSFYRCNIKDQRSNNNYVMNINGNNTAKNSNDDHRFLQYCFKLHSLLFSFALLCLRKDDGYNIAIYTDIEKEKDKTTDSATSSNNKEFELDENDSFRPQGIGMRAFYAASMRQPDESYYKHHKLAIYSSLTPNERRILLSLKDSRSRYTVVLSWIHEWLMCVQTTELQHVPPPIFSRLFQVLSEAHLGFAKACRVAEVPFPFVIAQCAELAVGSLIILVPLLNISVVDDNSALGSVLTFITVFIFISLYESARDIEDPFIFEPNQLPLCSLTIRNCKAYESILKNSYINHDYKNNLFIQNDLINHDGDDKSGVIMEK